MAITAATVVALLAPTASTPTAPMATDPIIGTTSTATTAPGGSIVTGGGSPPNITGAGVSQLPRHARFRRGAMPLSARAGASRRTGAATWRNYYSGRARTGD